VFACISGSAEDDIPLKRWLQGCLSCGVKVGINSFYLGLREFPRLSAIWTGGWEFGDSIRLKKQRIWSGSTDFGMQYIGPAGTSYWVMKSGFGTLCIPLVNSY
jgi:hypothetical protein